MARTSAQIPGSHPQVGSRDTSQILGLRVTYSLIVDKSPLLRALFHDGPHVTGLKCQRLKCQITCHGRRKEKEAMPTTRPKYRPSTPTNFTNPFPARARTHK
jgi:hypothetical protein